jgi:lysocardiolipin and lysophospholipid acyltransferase
VYRAWIDITKQSFGILLTAENQFFTPTLATMHGDKELDGVFRINQDGTLKTEFGDRAVLMANHQLYSDWVYMWWIAFTNRLHGAIYIVLKASLKKLPIFGWGMQNYRFIFLSRKWQADEKVLKDGLGAIAREKQWPAWLLLFPEGTTMSRNGYDKTVAYAKKTDTAVPKHVLLPRSKGLRYSLKELAGSVDYLYDATIHYSGMQEGTYGEDYYTLRTMYLRGIYPDQINMYWRRYKVSDIPYDDEEAFEKWIQERWFEKDELLDRMINTGSFLEPDTPSNSTMSKVTVPVKLNSPLQLFQIFSVPLNVLLLGHLVWNHLLPLSGLR